MAIYEFEEKRPRIGSKSFVHEYASIIGDVVVGTECFIGSGAVLRGDYGSIRVGDRSSIQENSVIHAREGEQCLIGNDVQIGHGAVLHNCEVKDFAVIGLGSRICDYATVGIWAIIGEGAVVPTGKRIEDGSIAVGIPAKEIRKVTEEDKTLWGHYKAVYADLCERYAKGLKRIS